MLALRSRWGTIGVALMVLALCLGTQAVSFVTAEEAKSQGDVSEGAEKSSATPDDSATAADDAADKAGEADAAASDKEDKGKSAKKKASKKREEGARKKKTNTRQPGRDQQKKQTGRGGSIGGVGAAGSSGQGTTSSGEPGNSKNSAPAEDKATDSGNSSTSEGESSAKGRVGENPGPGVGEEGPDPKIVEKVMAIQDKHTRELLKQEGIVATATGLDKKGNVVVKVYTSGAGKPVIPKELDGIPVDVELRGTIERFSGSAGSAAFDPRARLTRPIPIGVSGINMSGTCGSLCATGTIGCRLKAKDGSGYYALSNNHVFALENEAALNTPIVQPGPLDNGCICVSADEVGKLFRFKAVNTDLSEFNVIDAAIIKTSDTLISNKTLADGYGVPRTYTYRKPFLGQSVMKYGRTTGFTKGRIVALNSAFPILFGNGIALFHRQITVRGINGDAFGGPGDSGSLVVDKDRFPLGLLFAGGGGLVELNPIQVVLDEFGMEIDGDDALDFDPPGKVGKSQPNRPK